MSKKTWIIALMLGLSWAVLTVVQDAIMGEGITIRTILTAVVSGLLFGLLFSGLMRYWSKRMLKKVVVLIDEDEQVIKEAGANHFKGVEGVGGKLVLTNRRLIFKSHKYNVQNHQEDFSLERMLNLRTQKLLTVYENVIVLQVDDASTHKFVVDEPEDWVKRIGNQKLHLGNAIM